jgi:hypothetical protein
MRSLTGSARLGLLLLIVSLSQGMGSLGGDEESLREEEGPRLPPGTWEEVPFELVRNRVVLPVVVEGSDPLAVTLDTGMPIDGVYLFHREFAARLEGFGGMEVRVGGAGSGEASRATLFDSVTIEVGEVVFPTRRIVVSNSPTTQGFPTDGVIGSTLFAGHAVEFDYDASVVRLRDPSFLPDSTWIPVPLSIRKNDIPFLEAVISVDGEEDVRADLYIDLASGEALELLIRPDMKFPVPDVEERYSGTGLSGDVHARPGRVLRLSIGPFTLHDVPAVFAEAAVRSRQEGADGVLAGDALRRFNVIFNLPREVLYLKPNEVFSRPFPR